MLNKIFIQNFALIDEQDISLGGGLQVITGETGAGKSIILGALRLILGERADVKSLANAEAKSIIEAEFSVSEQFRAYFDENDIDFEPNTIIRREILPSGKSRAFVNDVPVTLEVLKGLSTQLIDIHSQFETSNLFSESFQFKIVDGLSENKSLIIDYQQVFSGFQSLKKKLENYKIQLAEGNKEADYKQFLLNELSELDLDNINYQDIQNQLSMQENAEVISESLAHIIGRFHLEEIGVLSALNDSRNRLQKIQDVSPEFQILSQRMEESFLELKDILNELENESEKVEMNPELLQSLNELNNKLNALFLKHNVATIEELIAIREKLEQEQSNFDELEHLIEETEREIENKRAKLTKLSQELTKNRTLGGGIFVEKAETLLKQLGLEKAKIAIDLSEKADFGLFGKDEIQILFQANSGFPMKPIHTAISGGERSRVMLVVKKIMAENADLPTLILDEIDTGVSGKVAEEIGVVMREMSQDMQLIVISHLAQVAAKGNDHYKVMKRDIDGRTQSTIVKLSEEEKLREIAQLLSGAKITEAALQQAEELMK